MRLLDMFPLQEYDSFRWIDPKDQSLVKASPPVYFLEAFKGMKEKLFCGLWVSDSGRITSSVPAPLSAGQEIKICHSGVGHVLLCQNLRTDPCAALPTCSESSLYSCQTVFLWKKKHFRRPTSPSVSPAVVYSCAHIQIEIWACSIFLTVALLCSNPKSLL